MDVSKINIGELELFLEVAKLGSLREVARSKKMQPAQLSRTLKRLEQRIGKTLFERSHRGLILTPQGLKLRKNVEEVLNLLDVNIEEDSSLENEVSLPGIGAPTFLLENLVIPTLSKLHLGELIHKSKLVSLPNDRLILSGLRGIIKIAFHAEKLDWPDTWYSEKIGSISSKLYGSRTYFKKSSLSESEAMNEKYIYPIHWSPEGLREGVDSCPINLRNRKKSIGVSSAQMAKDLLHTHRSLSYLPTNLIFDSDKDIIEIDVKGWKKTNHPVFISAQIDSINKRMFNKLVKTSSDLF